MLMKGPRRLRPYYVIIVGAADLTPRPILLMLLHCNIFQKDGSETAITRINQY